MLRCGGLQRADTQERLCVEMWRVADFKRFCLSPFAVVWQNESLHLLTCEHILILAAFAHSTMTETAASKHTVTEVCYI